MFRNVEIITDASDLSRRVLTFWLIDAEMVLAFDEEQERPTKRHKFITIRSWSRSYRGKNTIARREVPQHAITQALEQFRQQIQWSDR